ncbi:MAG TPA: archease [Candidatus Thermoplasmatota archaeon]|nr:archease [Candidatus Thermoplasmatota archaeon]
MDRGFAYFEHTADVGIRAWGPTLESAFEEAAVGLVAHMVSLDEAKRVGEVRVEVEADSMERLLFRFLEEVLDLVQTRLMVVSSARVALDGNRLVATLEGESYDAARHGHVHEIKAITFHDLSVARSASGAEVRVIVDI